MRSGYPTVLFLVLVLAGAYYYQIAATICPVPIAYRIGELDERFNLTEEEARAAMAKAETVWEIPTGRDLFTYDPQADFLINFIFDERQALAAAEEDFKDRLNQAESVNEDIAKEYTDLVVEYDNLKADYEADVDAYKKRLDNYNAEVEKYNQEGGAPPSEFRRLEKEKAALDEEQTELNATSHSLNNLVTEINRLGNKGNQIIDSYNRGVNVYNQTFGQPREFTQGDYQGDSINIYTFANEAELDLVLAHELGHALSLGHVTGQSSIMYYLIGDQPDDLTISSTDKVEFDRVCSQTLSSFWERLSIRLGW